jgi:hypothetical protein
MLDGPGWLRRFGRGLLACEAQREEMRCSNSGPEIVYLYFRTFLYLLTQVSSFIRPYIPQVPSFTVVEYVNRTLTESLSSPGEDVLPRGRFFRRPSSEDMMNLHRV